MEDDTRLELTNVEVSWKQYVGRVMGSNRSLWLTGFFKDENGKTKPAFTFTDEDFVIEYPAGELSDSYPRMDIRDYYLTQSSLSYGRKDNKFWIKLRETRKDSNDLVETLAWNESDDWMQESTTPPAYLMRLWSFLRANGEAERWIQYWFEMIYESIEAGSIVDTASARAFTPKEDGQDADLDDWIKYCLEKIKVNMEYLGPPNKMIVD